MLPASFKELLAERPVALDVLVVQAWPLGGEPVGPGENRQLLPERSGGPHEPLRRVVRSRMAHKTYLQVQDGEAGYEVCGLCPYTEPPADTVGKPGAHRVVGHEHYLAFILSACQRLSDVVEQTNETQGVNPLLPDIRPEPAFVQLTLYPPDHLQRVPEYVQVVEGPLLHPLRQFELRDGL